MKNTICITTKQLRNLLEVHEERKRTDATVSDCIEIKLIEPTQVLNKADKCEFRAQSIYQECNTHFLGTN